jgi:transcriptional regulator with XRE-family HTH domain
MITGEQIRSARAMLRLDQRQFATMARIAVSTVQRLERARGPVIASTTMLDAPRRTLEDAGNYSGIGGPGIRLKGEPVATDVILDLETTAARRAPIAQIAKPA